VCPGNGLRGVYLREDAVSGMSYLENQSEVRAPTADVAARLLDAAIAARTVPRQFALLIGFFIARRHYKARYMPS